LTRRVRRRGLRIIAFNYVGMLVVAGSSDTLDQCVASDRHARKRTLPESAMGGKRTLAIDRFRLRLCRNLRRYWLGRAGLTRGAPIPSGLDCGHERTHPEDPHHPLHVVGQEVETDLGSHVDERRVLCRRFVHWVRRSAREHGPGRGHGASFSTARRFACRGRELACYRPSRPWVVL
jgi:hypothetical protein